MSSSAALLQACVHIWPLLPVNIGAEKISKSSSDTEAFPSQDVWPGHNNTHLKLTLELKQDATFVKEVAGQNA